MLAPAAAALRNRSGRPDARAILPAALLDGVIVSTGDPPGVAPDAAATRLARRLSAVGVRTATLEASDRPVQHQPQAFTVVMEAGGRLPDPPDPTSLLRTADALEVHPARVAVVATDPSTVEAACRGGFGLVVGVDAAGDASVDLIHRGAEMVIDSLDALTLPTAPSGSWPDAGQTRVPDSSWWLDYDGLDPVAEGVRETLCALANGYMATRGADPEASGEPGAIPARTRPASSTAGSPARTVTCTRSRAW